MTWWNALFALPVATAVSVCVEVQVRIVKIKEDFEIGNI